MRAARSRLSGGGSDGGSGGGSGGGGPTAAALAAAGWQKVHDPSDGATYFYHAASGESAWEAPTLPAGGGGLKPENLAKLNGLPLVMGSAGAVALLTMWIAVATPGWIQGTKASSKCRQLVTPRKGPTHWAPGHCLLGARASRLRSRRFHRL